MPLDNQSFTTTVPHSTLPPSEGGDPEFQLANIWGVIRRRKLLILGLALLGLVLAFLVNKTSTKLYSSTATLEVDKLSDTPLGVTTLTRQPQNFSSSDEMTESMLTEIQELQNASIAFKVIDKTGLAAVPPYRQTGKDIVPTTGNGSGSSQRTQAEQERLFHLFQSRLKVDIVKDTKLIQVTFTDSDPGRAAAVANAVISVYVSSYEETRTAAADRAATFLTAHVADLRTQVLESEQRINDYEQRTGIMGSPDQVNGGVTNTSTQTFNSDNAVVERYLDLSRDLTNAETTRIAKEAVYRITDTQDPDTILSMSTSDQIRSASAGQNALAGTSSDLDHLSDLRKEQASLALQLASQSNVFGSKSPEMIRLNAQIKELDIQLRAEMTHIHRRAESEFRLAQANESGLRQLVAEQKKEVARLTVGGNQLSLLQQDASSKRALLQDLSTKLAQTNAASGVEASNITVVDPARPASAPSSPKTGNNLAIGMTVGALLGIFLAFLFDFQGDSPRSPAYSGTSRAAAATLAVMISLGWLVLPAPLRAQAYPSIPANLEQTGPTSSRPQALSNSTLQAIPEDFSNAPLAPGYLLELTVFGVPELSSTLRVDTAGDINIPLIGAVRVAGKTVTQAQNDIAAALLKGDILKVPQVTLNVLQFAAGSVTVLGEVQSPGRLQFFRPRTLEEVLALAGGETTAAGNTIEIQRPGEPSIHIRYTQGSSPETLRQFTVKSGDAVYVQRAGVIYVLGAVNRPGGYLMVNRGELNVLEAISVASGITLFGKTGTLRLLRHKEDGTYDLVDVPFSDMTKGKVPPITLHISDILYVQTSVLKSIFINGGGVIGSAAGAAIYRVP